MYKKIFKRIIDIVLSLLGIIILSPIIIILAVLVRVKLGSPIFFSQARPGKDEKIFKMHKFRSMTDERDEEGNLLPDKERLPKFGRILRSTSLDELPELWNILRGDMSIVGPRPLLTEYLPYYKKNEKKRHNVRPGLTGLAQINGRNSGTWEQRFVFDLEYVKKCNLLGDIKIVFKTIGKVIKKSDILVGDEIPAGRLDDYRKKENKMFRYGDVVIRKFNFQDIEAKIKWVNDEKNNKYLSYELPLEYDKTCNWYESIKERNDRFDAVVEYNGVPVGLIGLLNIDNKNMKAEEYILIGDTSFKNKGIGKKAGDLLLTYAFNSLNLNKVYAFVNTENKASAHLYSEKRRFRIEGTLKDEILSKEGYVDRYYMGMLKEEFIIPKEIYIEE